MKMIGCSDPRRTHVVKKLQSRGRFASVFVDAVSVDCESNKHSTPHKGAALWSEQSGHAAGATVNGVPGHCVSGFPAKSAIQAAG